MFHTRIRLPDGHDWNLRQLYDDPPRRNQLLKPFHLAKRRPHCLCAEREPVRLIVRRVHGNFRLACYPGTTAIHDPRCYFYSAEEGRVGQAYTLDAVEKQPDGGIYVRLDQSLAAARPTVAQHISAERKQELRRGATRFQRNTVKLQGLLQILWERAGLHRWHPRNPGDNRRYTEIVDRLTDAAIDVRVPAGNLTERLYLPPPTYDDGGQTLRATARRAGTQQAILIIGEFLSSRPTEFGEAVTLVCLRDCPLFLSKELWAGRTNSYRRPRRTDDERFWLIAICTLSPAGHVNVKDAAWMECQRNYIVVHSAYERRVADLLVLQERTFVKPVRYDTTEEDAVFPDFVLNDVRGGPYPMEVWGLDTPAYLARMVEKRAHYGARLWEWNACKGEEVPPFPPEA